MRFEKTRAVLDVGPEVTTKSYRNPQAAAEELAWYQRVPWACPRLVDADPDNGVLVMATHPVARSMRTYRPVQALASLLRRLEAEHVHHRDVHPGNIVAGPTGPLLIDWETAIFADAPSYDLYGPDVSGVPVPEIHAALPTGYRMWWGADHRLSIMNYWRADAPLPSAP